MYNFIIDCTDAALAAYKIQNSFIEYASENRGDLNWCLQTYMLLAKRGNIQVTLNNHPTLNGINIIHSDTLLNIHYDADYFIVCVQADYPRRKWAHYHLVQNKSQVFTNTAFIPHWVQPGLIGRNADRTGIKRVAYSGQTWNSNLAGSIDDWHKLLDPYAIEFAAVPHSSWHDLSTIDILIALRSFDTNAHNKKPPSKLFNAWHAKIPFIGGYDSAYSQVGTPGEDYLLAKSPEEVIENILKLKENPALYSHLVENGTKKAVQYTEQTIAETWENILAGPILERYSAWQKHRLYEKLRFNIMRSAGVMEHNSKRIVKILLKSVK